MGAGEYISVSAQADTEEADVETERRELNSGPAARKRELNELVRMCAHVLSCTGPAGAGPACIVNCSEMVLPAENGGLSQGLRLGRHAGAQCWSCRL